MSLLAPATLPIGLALVLDLALGELPNRIHPVAWFGRLVAPFDREWSHPTAVGAAVALALPLGAAGIVAGFVVFAASFSWLAAAVAAGLVLYSTTSLRMLVGTARAVACESENDLGAARQDLLALAGRDAESLSAGQVRSAAVESAAENLADGLVGPLLAFTLLAPVSLPAAAGAATWVKGVNTLDSMLGYRHKPVGEASARIDDLVMWLPARLSALLLAVAVFDPLTVRVARRWADEPSSPNSGWPMATIAAVLGVRLEKPSNYVLNPNANLPTVADAERGVRVVTIAGLLAYLLAGVLVWS